MEIKLNQEQINRIAQLLNEFPIKELPRVQAISEILNQSNKNKNESNKKN
jgi:hypothetical protein